VRLAQALLWSCLPQLLRLNIHTLEKIMKKLFAAALLAFAVPAFAHAADEAKPADKSAKKTTKKDDKKDEKKDDKAATPAPTK
jgi:hypothetical protein